MYRNGTVPYLSELEVSLQVEKYPGWSYISTVPVLYRTFQSWRYPCRWWSIPAGSSAAPAWSPASGSSGSGLLKLENIFAFWQIVSGSGSERFLALNKCYAHPVCA